MPRLEQVAPSTSQNSDHHVMSCEILRHTWKKDGSLELKVRLDSGTECSVTGEEAKIDFPEVLAAYIKPKSSRGNFKAWKEWAEKIDTSRVNIAPAIAATGGDDRPSAQIPRRKSTNSSTKRGDVAGNRVGVGNADGGGLYVDLTDEREFSNGRSLNPNDNAERTVTLTDRDVVFYWNDSGDMCQLQNHVGNVAFRKLVGSIDSSMALAKKAHFAKGMVDSLYDQGGRFLEKIETAGGSRLRDLGRRKATELTLNILNGRQSTSTTITKSPKTASMPGHGGKDSEGRTISNTKRSREEDKQQLGLGRVKAPKISPLKKVSYDPVAARALAALATEDSSESSSESDSNINNLSGDNNSSSPKPDAKPPAVIKPTAVNVPSNNNSSSLIPASMHPTEPTNAHRNDVSSSSKPVINATNPTNSVPPNGVASHGETIQVDNYENNQEAAPPKQGGHTAKVPTQHKSEQLPKKVKSETASIPEDETKITLNPSQSLVASKFPVGCPVSFNFRAHSTHLARFSSLGSVSVGVVDSVEMKIKTHQLVYHVKKRMEAGTAMLCEDDLAFATNCPVYIDVDKEEKVRGEVLVCNWCGPRDGEDRTKWYTVAIHANDDERHILDKVEEQHLKFRNEIMQSDETMNDDIRPSHNDSHNPSRLPSNEYNSQTPTYSHDRQRSTHARTDDDRNKRKPNDEKRHSNHSSSPLSNGGNRSASQTSSGATENAQREEIEEVNMESTQDGCRPSNLPNQVGDEPSSNNGMLPRRVATNHAQPVSNHQNVRSSHENSHSSVGNSTLEGSAALPIHGKFVELDASSSSSLSYDDLSGEHHKANRLKDDASKSVTFEMTRNEVVGSPPSDSRHQIDARRNKLTSSMTDRGDDGKTILRIDIPRWLQHDLKLRARLFQHLLGGEPGFRRGHRVKGIADRTKCNISIKNERFGDDMYIILSTGGQHILERLQDTREMIGEAMFEIVQDDGAIGKLYYDYASLYPENAGLNALFQWNPFSNIRKKSWMTVVPLPFVNLDGKFEFHGEFIAFERKWIWQESRCQFRICGDSFDVPTKLCDPYVFIHGRHPNDVNKASQIIKDLISKHCSSCTCTTPSE
mmetsp:Transcript_8661/g.18185  ORF Transcript_8661/g.18185 Transcript_8661/m.18185 type:complete len:1094 (-) Transcript_8661:318-3599(-)